MDDVVDEGDVALGNGVGVAGVVEDGAEKVAEDGVAEPLGEGGDGDAAHEAVDGGAVAEEGAVVVPALVGAVEVEGLLVLAHLQRGPHRVLVADAVVLYEELARLFLLVVDVQPARGLGDERAEEDDDAAKEALQPGDEAPGVGGRDLEAAAGGAGGEDGTAEPEAVVDC